MKRVTRRSTVLASAAVAGALAGCAGLTGTGGSSLDVTSVTAEPAVESAEQLSVGVPAAIRVGVENTASSSATEPLTLTVGGTDMVTEQVTVDAGSSEVWELRYVFRTAGSTTVAVGGVSQDVSVGDGVVPERTTRVRSIAAERESESNAIVEARLEVENPHDRTVFTAPLVGVGGMRATIEAADGGDTDQSVQIPPGETRLLIAQRVVTADDSYEVTVDGEAVGTADSKARTTQYRLGTPGRTGPRLPSGGIGTEPELVADFSFSEPDDERFPEVEELLEITLQAVTDERLYLLARWRQTDGGSIGSLAALDRWSGDELWHDPVVPGSEVAVVDGTEYFLAATSPKRMVLIARSMGQTEQWRRELDVPQQRWNGTNLVPAGESLYLTTPDGVVELDRESGETRRTLPGAFAMVDENAVYTFGGEGPLSKFPRDGSTTTPTWQRTPGDGTRETGAVANGRAYVSSFSGGDPSDYQYSFHAYDTETGDHQWDVAASQSANTAVGIRLPGLPAVTLRNGYLMWTGGKNIVNAETGQRTRTDGIRGGRAGSPLRPLRVYGVDREEFYVTSALPSERFRGRSVPGENAVPLPEPLGDSLRADMLYGRGVMYVATVNGVYGYSGALPGESE